MIKFQYDVTKTYEPTNQHLVYSAYPVSSWYTRGTVDKKNMQQQSRVIITGNPIVLPCVGIESMLVYAFTQTFI